MAGVDGIRPHPPSDGPVTDDFISLPPGVGDLLEVQLDPASVVLAVLGLHGLVDARSQLAVQLAPRLAGDLLRVDAVLRQVGQTAAGSTLLTGEVRLTGLAGLLLVAGVGQGLRRLR